MTDSSVPAARRRTKPFSARAVTLIAGKNPRQQRGNGAEAGLGQGMEMALTLAVFFGLGWLIDGWLGTRPAFMIALTVFAVVGQSVRMWIEYDARMKRLEAERKAATSSHQTAKPQVSPENGQL
ncbi:MAG: putative F0F1-ATPase subunit Ca2+/Mg2+ transporter [Actinomycetota bacterium]|jgi:F0F1-type ATP synthase assembly protein I